VTGRQLKRIHGRAPGVQLGGGRHMCCPCSVWHPQARLLSVLLRHPPCPPPPPPPGRALAVEVDGPYHYTRNMPAKREGATVLRDRMIRLAGLPLVTIPHHQWKDVSGRQSQQDLARAGLPSAACWHAIARSRPPCAAAPGALTHGCPSIARSAGRGCCPQHERPDAVSASPATARTSSCSLAWHGRMSGFWQGCVLPCPPLSTPTHPGVHLQMRRREPYLHTKLHCAAEEAEQALRQARAAERGAGREEDAAREGQEPP
jgi:hypothetical protein